MFTNMARCDSAEVPSGTGRPTGLVLCVAVQLVGD